MLTLYGFLASENVLKARQILAHVGLPYRRVEVSQMAGDTQQPAFLAINPMGKVPVLRFPDGRVLSESGPILLHLAAGTRYWPRCMGAGPGGALDVLGTVQPRTGNRRVRSLGTSS
jgi:glutathione S-transferase